MKALFQLRLVVAGLVASVLGSSAFATTTGPDLTALTSSVSSDSTVTAILAIAGVIAVIYMAIRGAKIVLSMIRG
ncbi:MAG: hypothetical protein WCN27_02835 [Alphaproteobacteria bacterium]